MGTFSIWHWLVVLLIVLLIFGTKRLKNLGNDLGESIKNFKNALTSEKNSDKSDDKLEK